MTKDDEPRYVIPPHVPDGMAAVIYSPHVIREAYAAAVNVLQRHRHSPVTMLALAAMIVDVHRAFTNATSDEPAFEIVCMFIERLRVLKDAATTAVSTPGDSEAT